MKPRHFAFHKQLLRRLLYLLLLLTRLVLALMRLKHGRSDLLLALIIRLPSNNLLTSLLDQQYLLLLAQLILLFVHNLIVPFGNLYFFAQSQPER